MKKKIFSIMMIAVIAVAGTACGHKKIEKKSSEKDSSKTTEQVQTTDDDNDDVVDDKQSTVNDTDTPDEMGDADPTKEIREENSKDEMRARYIGEWKQIGMILSDGSIDNSDGTGGRIILSKDGTVSIIIRSSDGSESKKTGKWEVNSDKKVAFLDYKMGIDENGYLLRDSGERDGKGYRLYYAYKKA